MGLIRKADLRVLQRVTSLVAAQHVQPSRPILFICSFSILQPAPSPTYTTIPIYKAPWHVLSNKGHQFKKRLALVSSN